MRRGACCRADRRVTIASCTNQRSPAVGESHGAAGSRRRRARRCRRRTSAVSRRGLPAGLARLARAAARRPAGGSRPLGRGAMAPAPSAERATTATASITAMALTARRRRARSWRAEPTVHGDVLPPGRGGPAHTAGGDRPAWCETDVRRSAAGGVTRRATEPSGDVGAPVGRAAAGRGGRRRRCGCRAVRRGRARTGGGAPAGAGSAGPTGAGR